MAEWLAARWRAASHQIPALLRVGVRVRRVVDDVHVVLDLTGSGRQITLVAHRVRAGHRRVVGAGLAVRLAAVLGLVLAVLGVHVTILQDRGPRVFPYKQSMGTIRLSPSA